VPGLAETIEEMFDRAYTCYFCESKEKIYDHHILPQWVMGPDSAENLVPVCMSCHKKLENLTKRVIYRGTKGIQKKFRDYMKRHKSYVYPASSGDEYTPPRRARDPYYYLDLTDNVEIFLQMVKFIVHEFLPKWNKHKVKTVEEVALSREDASYWKDLQFPLMVDNDRIDEAGQKAYMDALEASQE